MRVLWNPGRFSIVEQEGVACVAVDYGVNLIHLSLVHSNQA